MNWIIYSLISLLFFSVMIILVSGQTKKGFSVPFTLAFVMGLWIPFFGFSLLREGINFSISISLAAILIICGILYIITNWCAFKSANDSPNPGFAFAIINSNSVLIAIFERFFLQEKLSVVSMFGILISLAGVVILGLVSSEKKQEKKKWWVVNALVALFTSAVYSILVVVLLDRGVSLNFILFSTAVLSFPIYFLWSQKGLNFRTEQKVASQTAIALILAGALSVLGNWSMLKAAFFAPNPGFAFAISNSKPALVALLARFFLRSELNLKQIIGILINIAGIIIITLS